VNRYLKQRNKGSPGALEGLAGERNELAEEGAKAMEGLGNPHLVHRPENN
jgi:hypothetical protein